VDGTPYARLRPGADLAKLEAAGKVLGLALRARHPLGVDLCAPLAHLLAHPRLPQALESITSTVGDGAAGSLLAVDFSGDGAPPLPRMQGWERLRRRRQGRQRLVAASELLSIGFSREWLRWVSGDEYAYWQRCLAGAQPVGERAQQVRALEAELPDGRAVTLRNVREHMARRALETLVLDVRKETEALWRGLHAVPGVGLPRLDAEVRGSKRLRSRTEEEDREEPLAAGARTRKRQRREAEEASSSRKRRRGSEEGPDADEPAAKRPRGSAGAEGLEPSPLQALLSGDRTIPVGEWQRLTSYDFGSEVSEATIAAGQPVARPGSRAARTLAWFWAYVTGLSAEERADLLEWVTGYRRLPKGGFPPPVRRMTICLVDSADRLPVAHTCSLQLDLPAGYADAETLRSKLSEASAQRRFFMA